MGVDGSGKSTAITYLLQHSPAGRYRRMYFGSNEYWIPGLLKLHKLFSSIPIVRYVMPVLMRFDRQTRIFYALYLKMRGKIVLCDRYYYDDLFVDYVDTPKITIKQKVKHFINKLLSPKMLITPDITFFLNVEPEVAYGRKQDYDLEIVRKNIEIYRKILAGRVEVKIINANATQDEIIGQIEREISELTTC